MCWRTVQVGFLKKVKVLIVCLICVETEATLSTIVYKQLSLDTNTKCLTKINIDCANTKFLGARKISGINKTLKAELGHY